MVAAMLNPPFSIRAEKAGLKDMGTAAAALALIRERVPLCCDRGAPRTPTRWSNISKPISKACAGVSTRRIGPRSSIYLSSDSSYRKTSRALSYDSTKNDFNRDGAIDMDGLKNVLKLRAQFEGGTPASPEKYLDLSYYQKARAGF